MSRKSTPEDFERRLEVDANGCWNWTGSAHSSGYGWVMYQGQNWKAHRLAYDLFVGPIPDGRGYHGAVVMHTCDNRLCCNPDHLVLGDHARNMADMQRKGRRKGVCSGTRNGRAKLTEGNIRKIMSDDRPNVRIAKDYGVAPSTIDRVKKRYACLAM